MNAMNRPHNIKLSDGRSFTAQADQSILSAALQAGLLLPHSCKGGLCGTCEARLISGRIAYPHDKLPPALDQSQHEAATVLICQARALSDVELAVRVGRFG